jgi:hypothetical protein
MISDVKRDETGDLESRSPRVIGLGPPKLDTIGSVSRLKDLPF